MHWCRDACVEETSFRLVCMVVTLGFCCIYMLDLCSCASRSSLMANTPRSRSSSSNSRASRLPGSLPRGLSRSSLRPHSKSGPISSPSGGASPVKDQNHPRPPSVESFGISEAEPSMRSTSLPLLTPVVPAGSSIGLPIQPPVHLIHSQLFCAMILLQNSWLCAEATIGLAIAVPMQGDAKLRNRSCLTQEFMTSLQSTFVWACSLHSRW